MNDGIRQYIGLDLGGRFTHFCALDAAGDVVERGHFRTSPEELAIWSAARSRVRVALETGTHAGWVARILVSDGHTVVVANSRHVRAVSQNQRKCDAADAETLARLLRVDASLLRPVSAVLERDAIAITIVRARAHLVDQRTAMINHVRGVARAHGVTLRSVDAARFDRVVGDLPADLRSATGGITNVIAAVNAEVAVLDTTIAQICADAYPETRLLRTIPGVGAVVALYFVLVVADPARFGKRRDVGAYVGLTPRRYQSGETDRQLPVSKSGDAYLRRLLVAAARSHLRAGSGALREWGTRRAAGGAANRRRAVVGVARKLSILMHRLWSTGEEFRPWPRGGPASQARA